VKTGYVTIAFSFAIAVACSASASARAAAAKHGAAAQPAAQDRSAEPAPSSARPAPSSAGKSAGEDPIAIVEGRPIYERDLVGAAAAQLLQARQQEYKIASEALNALILQKVVENEAKKQGISVERLYEKEVDSKIPEPSDDEARGYYLAVKGQTTLPFEQIKSQVKRLLKNAEVQQARARYADSLRGNAEVAVFLQPPAVELGENDPARIEGNPTAPISIVEFADFQCPYCGRVEPTLAAILKKYDSKVKLAFRDFPLSSIHPYAEGAAEASRCAEAMGKFWPMHDAMYANQSKLTQADLIKTAGSLGMDESAFSACLKSGKYKPAIQQDVAAGLRVGVTGTPAFFINGRYLSGSVPEAQFDQIIDSELSQLASSQPARASH